MSSIPRIMAVPLRDTYDGGLFDECIACDERARIEFPYSGRFVLLTYSIVEGPFCAGCLYHRLTDLGAVYGGPSNIRHEDDDDLPRPASYAPWRCDPYDATRGA
jgi:hypothetical protein